MKTYIVNVPFDGAKFAARYGLNSLAGDFSMAGNVLSVRPDFKVTDDPPIFDPPDPFVPVPAGVRVHHWPELVGWVGKHKIPAHEIDGPHHECYYVIADDEVALNALMAMPNAEFEIGQPAYLKDKKLLVTWDGTKWK